MTLLSHHAYLIQGTRGTLSALDFLTEKEISLPSETIIVERTFATLGIDDARELSHTQLMKTAEGSVAVFLIETEFMTREAQNALLKTLEEPSPRTHFILVTPHPQLLLPTLRSRLEYLESSSVKNRTIRAGFRTLSFSERAALIAPILEEGNRSQAEMLMRTLTVELHEKTLHSHTKTAKLTGQLDRLHGYITDPSSSVKLILEYAMYSVPSA